MHFIHPAWFYALPVLLPAMAALYLWGERRRRAWLERIGGERGAGLADVSRGKRRLRFLLMLAVTALLVTAAARPWWGRRTVDFHAVGRDILVVFDVSKSMLATDVVPSRLKHAQFLLTQLAERNKGDRFGLIAFAGNAFLECPLTSDIVSFKQFVDDLSPASIPLGGTNIERALAVAAEAFQAADGQYRAVVLITDGDELAGDSARAIAAWKERRVPLIVVGIGDPEVPALVPEPDGSYKRDAAGELVKTKLAEPALRRLAAETGGLYVRSTAAESGLDAIDRRIKALVPEASEAGGTRSYPIERFPGFLAAAGVLLLFYLLLSERRGRAAIVAFLLLTGLTAAAEPAETPPLPEKPAEEKLPEDPVRLYNAALEKQRAGEAGSEAVYAEAIRRGAAAPEVRSRSFFNLGTGELRAARRGLGEAKQALRSQQLPAAKERLMQCRGELARAEELYGQALMQPAADTVPPEWVSGNLQKLADDTAEVEELLKKIEELERQQQQARDQTQQAKDQNRQEQQDKQDPQNQQGQQDQQDQQDKQAQQNQQQSQPSAGDRMRQARESAEQLAEQAKELEQHDLKGSAERAAEEIRQAETAREAGKPEQAEKHLDAALKELGEKAPESPKEDKKNDQGKDDPAKDKEQPSPEQKQPQEAAASASPAGEKKPKPDREAARRMLEVMADQEKELRDALKEQAARQLPKVEKDW